MTAATTPPTPDSVAGLLPLVAGYHDGFDWSVSLCVNGPVAEIDVTPGDGGGRDLPEVQFRAVVVEGESAPIVLAPPASVGYFDDDTQLVLHHGLICSQGIRRGDWTPAQAREFAAHLAALADQAEAQSGGGLNA